MNQLSDNDFKILTLVIALVAACSGFIVYFLSYRREKKRLKVLAEQEALKAAEAEKQKNLEPAAKAIPPPERIRKRPFS